MKQPHAVSILEIRNGFRKDFPPHAATHDSNFERTTLKEEKENSKFEFHNAWKRKVQRIRT